MFDLGWIEIFFVCVLALIVVGPKDLPKLARSLGQIFNRAQRLYRDMAGSITKLEREIDVASRPHGAPPEYLDLLSDEVRANLMNTPRKFANFQHGQHASQPENSPMVTGSDTQPPVNTNTESPSNPA